jgi:hypothetical protein
MRFLANENVPGPLIQALINAGCDVAWVRTISPGIPDGDVLALAARENRVLVTFDKDFGEIARGADLPATCGVVLFRMPMPPFRNAARLADLIVSRDDWAGHFSIIEPGRVRTRPLENL